MAQFYTASKVSSSRNFYKSELLGYHIANMSELHQIGVLHKVECTFFGLFGYFLVMVIINDL